MLQESKMNCYKNAYIHVENDRDCKELMTVNKDGEFGFKYYVGNVLYTYTILKKTDLLKLQAILQFGRNCDSSEFVEIADDILRDTKDIIHVDYDNYIKFTLAVQLGNLPDKKAQELAELKFKYFHNMIKSRTKNIEQITVKASEMNSQGVANNENILDMSDNKESMPNIMEQYLDSIKVPYEHHNPLKGTISNISHGQSIEYSYQDNRLTLIYMANGDIVPNAMLQNTMALFKNNKCQLDILVKSKKDIERYINDFIKVIDYIKDKKLIKEKTLESNKKDNQSIVGTYEKWDEAAKKEVIAGETTTEETTTEEAATEEATTEEAATEEVVAKEMDTELQDKAIKENAGLESIKAKFFGAEEPSMVSDNTKTDIKENKEESNAINKEIDLKKLSYENPKVQKQFTEMYKNLNSIYKERETVYQLKEQKLKERENYLEKEKETVEKNREKLCQKWEEFNSKQKEFNSKLKKYTDEKTELDQREIEITKAMSEYEEKSKDYEVKSIKLKNEVEKNNLMKHEIQDKQAKLVEMNNDLDEKMSKLKLQESEINKKIEMNELKEHQLIAREQNLEAQINSNVASIKIEELKKENKQLKDQLDEVIQECNKRLKEMEDNANRMIKTAHDQAVNQLKSKNMELNSENEKFRNEIQELNYYKDSLTERLQKSQNLEAESSANNEKLNIENKRLNDRIYDLEDELKKFKMNYEPECSAQTVLEVLKDEGYNMELIHNDGDFIVGGELISGITMCINGNEKMIYAEKPVKRGTKYVNRIADWNQENITASYSALSDKVICKKVFKIDSIVADVNDIINKFQSLR